MASLYNVVKNFVRLC